MNKHNQIIKVQIPKNKTKEQDIIFNMNMFCSFKVVIVEYQHHQIVVDILYIYFQLELDKMY